jgi:GDP-L-fucose synthase
MINLKTKKILVTGGNGFLGKHIIQNLIEKRGVPKQNIYAPSSRECDLRVLENCARAVSGQDIVIHLAANVGGIGYNQEHPGELFYDNAIMGIQLMEAARRGHVEKFVCLGTICAYPKHTPIPFKEDNLWNGYPEETNAPYGLAKKMLLVQAQAYRKQYGFNAIYLLPVNMYGPGDEFGENRSHVIAAIIKKIYDAKTAGLNFIEAWGSGAPTREFIYVEDAAEGILLATERYNESEPVNVGSGEEISINNLVALIARLMNFQGNIKWNPAKPDGQPRRSLDINAAQKKFGFHGRTDLKTGLQKTIKWYTANAKTNSHN